MTRIPELVGTPDIASLKLTATENYLLMLVDGRASAEDIAAASGMPDAASALERLVERGVLRFRDDVGPAKVAVGRMPIQRVALGPVNTTVKDEDPRVILARAEAAKARGDLVEAREQCNLAWMAAPSLPEVNRLRSELDALEKAQAQPAPVKVEPPKATGPAIPDAAICKTPKARPLLLSAIKKAEAKDYDGAFRDLQTAVMMEAGNARLVQFRDDVDRARKQAKV